MKVLLCLCGVFCTLVYVKGHPIDAIEVADKFEGDIDLTPEELEEMFRTGLISEAMRWPNATVPYVISGAYSEEQLAYIRKGMDTIELVSCVKFKPKQETDESYVDIISTGSGCSSNTGCLCRGKRQTLNLAPDAIEEGCFQLAVIMHELIHVLGFYHMHSAYDRDDYIQILKENILEGKELNFNKYKDNYVSHFGVGYDYNSVMHYSMYAGSKNGKPTIVPKDPYAKIGQRVGLSWGDITKINNMYNCPI